MPGSPTVWKCFLIYWRTVCAMPTYSLFTFCEVASLQLCRSITPHLWGTWRPPCRTGWGWLRVSRVPKISSNRSAVSPQYTLVTHRQTDARFYDSIARPLNQPKTARWLAELLKLSIFQKNIHIVNRLHSLAINNHSASLAVLWAIHLDFLDIRKVVLNKALIFYVISKAQWAWLTSPESTFKLWARVLILSPKFILKYKRWHKRSYVTC